MLPKNLKSSFVALLGTSVLFISILTNAQDSTVFQEGINAFQQQKWDEAKGKFAQLLSQERWRFAALYNLGNIAMRQGHPGEALAFYKQAQKLNPRDGDLRHNLAFASNQTGARKFTGSTSSFEVLRAEFLSRFTFDEFLAATLILLGVFGTSLIKYLGARKAARTEGGSGATPSPLLFVWGILFTTIAAGATLKLIDSFAAKAIVVVAKAELKSGPGEGNATMIDLPEGTEVKIRETASEWRQVTSPGGLTGWVPEGQIIVISGGGPW